MLSDIEKSNILKTFPKNIELSYDSYDHKKVSYKYYLAIPDGKRGFMWFTEYKNQNVCFFLEIGQNKHIQNIRIIKTCFNAKLSYGTVFYGTEFKIERKTGFLTEDIFYYKGKDISQNTYDEKLNILIDIYSKKEMNQVSYFDSQVIFGMPFISSNPNPNQEQEQFKSLSYKPTLFHGRNSNGFVKMIRLSNASEKEKIFTVKPDIQNDIYHLYLDNKLMDTAFIPDYKTSVMMNSLFRRIKENVNLDALEESDDEEEFEDDRLDKYVYLNKEFRMKCQLNTKFKKWVPTSVVI